MSALVIKNLHASIGKKQILNGISMTVKKGEVHVIMGPNGSGKSTLGNALLAHHSISITNGSVKLGNQELLGKKTDEIARAGLLIALQNPQTISGVTATNLLTVAIRKFALKKDFKMPIFRNDIKETAKELQIPDEFLNRSLNEGFSGGEKKKMEILQMSMLDAKCIIIDEIDSGLDIDALKLVTKQINKLQKRGVSLIIITHYNRILRTIRANKVHILYKGRIIKSGSHSLSEKIEKSGYELFIK